MRGPSFAPSPLRGEGWGEGRVLAMSSADSAFLAVIASDKAVSCRCRKEQSGFERLPAPELLLLCLSKGEVTKRKRHPDGAPSGHPALRVRGRVPGFFDGTPVPAKNWPASLRAILSDFPPPARRAIGAPGKAARSKRALFKRATAPQVCGTTAFARALALASGAHDARLLFRGPSAAVSRGRQGRAAGIAMEGDAFSTGQEARPKSPATAHGLAGQDARRASPRGALSLWLLSLWARKEKVARAPAGARNRSVANDKPQSHPHPNPLPQAGEGIECVP